MRVRSFDVVSPQLTDTRTNWENLDKIIPLGMICLEKSDTEEIIGMKIGDGRKKWKELKYVTKGHYHDPVSKIIVSKPVTQDVLKKIVIPH